MLLPYNPWHGSFSDQQFIFNVHRQKEKYGYVFTRNKNAAALFLIQEKYSGIDQI